MWTMVSGEPLRSCAVWSDQIYVRCARTVRLCVGACTLMRTVCAHGCAMRRAVCAHGCAMRRAVCAYGFAIGCAVCAYGFAMIFLQILFYHEVRNAGRHDGMCCVSKSLLRTAFSN